MTKLTIASILIFSLASVDFSHGHYNCQGHVCPNVETRTRGNAAGCIGFCGFGNTNGDNLMLRSEMRDVTQVCVKASSSAKCDEETFTRMIADLKLCKTENVRLFNFISSLDGSKKDGIITEEDFMVWFNDMNNNSGTDIITDEEHETYFDKLYWSKLHDSNCDDQNGHYNCQGHVCPNVETRTRGNAAGCIGFCGFGNKNGDNLLSRSDMRDVTQVCVKASSLGKCDEETFTRMIADLKLCKTENVRLFNFISSLDGSRKDGIITEEDFMVWFNNINNNSGTDIITADEHKIYFDKLYWWKLYDSNCDKQQKQEL